VRKSEFEKESIKVGASDKVCEEKEQDSGRQTAKKGEGGSSSWGGEGSKHVSAKNEVRKVGVRGELPFSREDSDPACAKTKKK